MGTVFGGVVETRGSAENRLVGLVLGCGGHVAVLGGVLGDVVDLFLKRNAVCHADIKDEACAVEFLHLLGEVVDAVLDAAVFAAEVADPVEVVGENEEGFCFGIFAAGLEVVKCTCECPPGLYEGNAVKAGEVDEGLLGGATCAACSVGYALELVDEVFGEFFVKEVTLAEDMLVELLESVFGVADHVESVIGFLASRLRGKCGEQGQNGQ